MKPDEMKDSVAVLLVTLDAYERGETPYANVLRAAARTKAALQADQPAATETQPVEDDPYDQCLVAGCIYTRGHKGKCFQPGDVVPAATPRETPAHSYAIGAGGSDDGCSACGAGQREPCTSDCAASTS